MPADRGRQAPRGGAFVARRFAVKEAAYKALLPVYALTWQELWLERAPGPKGRGSGRPVLVLAPATAAAVGRSTELHVSISHDGDYTSAVVLAARTLGGPRAT